MSPELTGPERDIVVACLVGDEPGAYNIPVFVRFDEPVDCARFARAADAVLAASPALRSRFVRDGRTIRRAPASAARTERLRARRDELSAVAAARRIEVTDEVLVRSAVRTRVRSPGQNGSRERGFGTLKYERLYIDEIDDAVMLAKHAEEYRIEYNQIRPHEALAWNRPKEVHLGLASPTVPTFQTTENLPTP